MSKKWGLSFLINTEAGPAAGTPAASPGPAFIIRYCWLDPRARVAGVLLTQILPFGDPVVLELLNAFERGVYEQARL